MNRSLLLLRAQVRGMGVQTRSLLYLLALGLVLSVALTWRASRQQKSVVYAEMELRGLIVTRNLAQASVLPIVLEDTDALQSLLRAARKQEDVLYIVLRDTAGKVWAEDAAPGVTPRAMPEAPDADRAVVVREPGVLHAASAITRERRKKIDFAEILSEEGRPAAAARERIHLGTIQLGLSTRRGERQIRRFILQSALGTTGLLALGGGIAFLLFSRAVVRPLEKLVDATREVGRGNLDRQIESLASSREFQLLATSFNKMIIDLQRAKGALVQTNQELEARVHERTLALENANNDLLNVNVHLKELLEMKSRFISMVSHELRTPLASIKGFALTLLRFRERFAADKVRRYTEVIHEESERLSRLIEELLDISRIQEGRIEIRPQAVDLAAIAERVAERYRMKKARAKFVVQGEAGAGEAHADPDKVEQVLVNLFDNALRFSPEGGAVVTRIFPQGDSVVTEVLDEGPGLPAEEIERIFEPFYRAENEVNTRNPGTGLGLSISRSLAEAMGGRLWAGNREPRGACFALVLPASAPSVAV